VNIVVGGNHKLAIDVLSWLLNSKENVSLIISENLDSKWEESFFEQGQNLAKQFNVPFLSGDINNFVEEIKKQSPDLLVLCRCKRLIKPSILEIPKIGVTNIHYGMLPRYGGIAPLHWAIKNGEKEIGITLHFMGEKFDEGDIIDQESFSTDFPKRLLKLPDRNIPIIGITTWEAYSKANQLGLTLFQNNFPKLKNGTYNQIKQDLSQKLYYEKNSVNFQNDKIINLNGKSDEEISNHVKAFTFPPCQMPSFLNANEYQELKIES